MPLYGHEMDETITPLEAGLGMFVRLEKQSFLGKEALLLSQYPARVRVGLRITGRGIAREKCAVFQKGTQVGMTPPSGTFCPYLNEAVAMALRYGQKHVRGGNEAGSGTSGQARGGIGRRPAVL
jgi:aminomethyltransferase